MLWVSKNTRYWQPLEHKKRFCDYFMYFILNISSQ